MHLIFEPTGSGGWWCYDVEQYSGEREHVGYGATRQEAADNYCDKHDCDRIVIEEIAP